MSTKKESGPNHEPCGIAPLRRNHPELSVHTEWYVCICESYCMNVCCLTLYVSCTVRLWLAGCRNKEMGKALKELFQTPYFRVVVMPDEETVELCGALKVCSGSVIVCV